MLKNKKLITLTSLGMLLGYCALQANSAVTAPVATDAKVSTTAQAQDSKTVPLDMKKLSEAFGHFIGRNLKSPGLAFDMESVIKGIRAGVNGEPAPLSDKEYEEMMTAVQEKAFKEMSSANLKAANDFLEKNRTEQGVLEIVPGKLQYLILNQGTGAVVEQHASPQIHYTGKYHDGTVFSTSEEMGGPITIPLDQTIPGFSKGILGMKEGEKRRLFVHPDLGYGTTGQLPPNELLVFDIELVKANAPESKQKGAVNPLDQDEDFDDDSLYLDEEEEAAHSAEKKK